ncbi:MAG: hypothetical protein ABIH89_04670, partial [Elusimicrobiota bacterium]
LQEPRDGDEGLLKRVISGLSSHRYEECAEAVPGVFGLSSSTVSRRYSSNIIPGLFEYFCKKLETFHVIVNY